MIDSTQLTKAALIINEAKEKLNELLGVEVNILMSLGMSESTTADEVLKIVSNISGVPIEIIKSRSKEQSVAYCRYVCFYLMRRYLHMTLNRIGDIFNKDHSTVINGLKIVTDEPNNKELQNLLALCEQHFKIKELHEN